jgi:hypothetical protein
MIGASCSDTGNATRAPTIFVSITTPLNASCLTVYCGAASFCI